mmetsp:Transcript_27264/g.55686  ORF Transcript_27264/g.55686 Transcript_27264/m.55686 type:complete len:160 (+) Transcript_27264:80-559(+)
MPSTIRVMVLAAICIAGIVFLAYTIASFASSALTNALLEALPAIVQSEQDGHRDESHRHKLASDKLERKQVVLPRNENSDDLTKAEGQGCALCVYVFPYIFRYMLYFQLIVLLAVGLSVFILRSKPLARSKNFLSIASNGSASLNNPPKEEGEVDLKKM